MTKKFDSKKYLTETIDKLAREVKDKNVLVAISGGVDSTTSARILELAGAKVFCVFIDTGFLRMNETKEVLDSLRRNNIKPKFINAKNIFYSALNGAFHPREKRTIFRDTYFRIVEKELSKNDIEYLVQGTQSKGDKMKRIYNNSLDNYFDESKVKLIEPVRGLSKDEIRQIARAIGITKDIAERKPFPGPGLLIRFGGSFDKKKIDVIRKATNITDNFQKRYKNKFDGCFQLFPYLCGEEIVSYINTKGVTDYGHVILVRAVQKKGKNYVPFDIPNEIRQKLMIQLMKIQNTARVCFDITSKNGQRDSAKHGATIEYE